MEFKLCSELRRSALEKIFPFMKKTSRFFNFHEHVVNMICRAVPCFEQQNGQRQKEPIHLNKISNQHKMNRFINKSSAKRVLSPPK